VRPCDFANRHSALGDAAERQYREKLDLFFRLAEPELRRILSSLGLPRGARVLDAGCGTGGVTRLLRRTSGAVVGLDLSRPHLTTACANGAATLLQASLSEPPFRPRSFDLVWCANALHHTQEPVRALAALRATLRPGGRAVLCQSSLLPDMLFAWDSALEQAVHAACLRHYRDKYALDGDHAAGWRRGLGWLREAGFEQPQARTFLIERTAPLDDAARAYIEVAIFRGYWGPAIDPYLTPPEVQRLRGLLDPESPEYALARPDFHFLQTLTCFVGINSG
jgi:SAM-dependent methyltransferase